MRDGGGHSGRIHLRPRSGQRPGPNGPRMTKFRIAYAGGDRRTIALANAMLEEFGVTDDIPLGYPKPGDGTELILAYGDEAVHHLCEGDLKQVNGIIQWNER